MILFSFPEYQYLALQIQRLPFVQSGQFRVSRFANQELYAVVETAVSGQHCLILGSIAPPDTQTLSLSLLAHTLKKEGAQRVSAVVPYLGYSRQDKRKAGESLGTAWIGTILEASGVDEVLTIDAHSNRDAELFPIPLYSISPAHLFAIALVNSGLREATFVAPDTGAIARCKEVENAAGLSSGEIVRFEKQRTESGITHCGPIGVVGPRVIIVDDMLDTGETLVSACEKLKLAGVEKIYIAVTHGLFTGHRWQKLWSLGVECIFCTDTIPLRSDIDASRIKILSVAPLVEEGLAALKK